MLKNKSHVHNLGSQKGPSDLYFQFGSFFGQFNKGDLATVYLGFASRAKIKGYCPRRMQARSWLRSPMRDRQTRPQRLQGKDVAGVGTAANCIYATVK